jgi:hypothetical protein
MTPAEEIRPPIPASCAHRPVVGGLVAPFVNMRLADGGVDFRTPHTAAYEKCWLEERCQTCGEQLQDRVCVLFGGPNQVRRLHFDEPPLCPPCAVYASRACPMVAGRMDTYARHDRVSEGRRGKTCSTPGCDCGGAVSSDPSAPDHKGDPAHPWYACYVRPGTWQLTGKKVCTPCSDGGCSKLHERMLLNGAILLAPPLKIRVVSEPGKGRVWHPLTAGQASALTTERIAS